MTTAKVTLRDIYDNINELRKEVRETYVTKEEFYPIRDEVTGIRNNLSKGVWIVLSAVFFGILGLLGFTKN
jgi:hypothetical protein